LIRFGIDDPSRKLVRTVFGTVRAHVFRRQTRGQQEHDL